MHRFHKVVALARKQAGAVSREQVLKVVSPSALQRAVAAGAMVKRYRGVFRLAAAAPGRQLDLWLALLWAGAGAVLSHLTAGVLWKLDGLGKAERELIHVSALAGRRLDRVRGVQLHRVQQLVPGKDTGALGGLPCTSLPRTVVDLAGLLDAHSLELAFDSAVRRDEAHRQAIIDTLERVGMRNRAGASALLEIATRAQISNTASPLESQVRIVLREAGVRPPMPQVQICDRNHDQIGIFDFVWWEARLVLFVDSWDHHSSRKAFEYDRRQMSALAANGWRVILVTHRRLRYEREAFVDEVRQALRHITMEDLVR